jgi:hypothetical protein
MRKNLRRLAGLATLVAVLSACLTASIVGGQLAADAASSQLFQDQVTQYMLLFSCWAFVLAWIAAFVIGWLIMSRRAAGSGE